MSNYDDFKEKWFRKKQGILKIMHLHSGQRATKDKYYLELAKNELNIESKLVLFVYFSFCSFLCVFLHLFGILRLF